MVTQANLPKVAFLARAKAAERWQTVGAAWERGDGKPGYEIKLDTLPVGLWDGRFILVPQSGDEIEEV